MSKNILLIIVSVFVLLISGCTTTSVMEIDGNIDGTSVVNKKSSDVDVKIIDTRVREVNGMLQVNALVESTTSSSQSIEYKFFWFDSAGMPVDSMSTSWQPVYINGRATAPINGLAPNPSAKAFKIQVKQSE